MNFKLLTLIFFTYIIFTVAFLIDAILTCVTLGFYVIFMPDDKLLSYRASLYSLKKQLKYHLEDDPSWENVREKLK